MKWRFAVIAGIILAVFCLYPQLNLWHLRGKEWNGHYAYNDIDEVAYASYLNALIDGRPRRNDPYSGRDDTPAERQPESLFSIQFAAPYTIAIPARLLGLDTPWAMIISGALAGFVSAFITAWLLFLLFRDNWFALAGSTAVFAFGALAAGEGALLEIAWDGFSYPYFPGFRRYIPALAMAAFFLALAALSKFTDAINSQSDKSRRNYLIWGLLSTFFFAYCVYSYFYIWTALAAFAFVLFVSLLLMKWPPSRQCLIVFSVLGAAWALILLPYFYLLSQRAETLDHVQLLVYSHKPDLFRVPEYIALSTLIVLAICLVSRKSKETAKAAFAFSLSAAVTVFIIFNQQLVTGRSLQPIHYQVFIGNYIAGFSLITAFGVLLSGYLGQGRNSVKIFSTILLIIATGWGFIECFYTVRVLDSANVERDKALLVEKRLKELAKESADPHRETVFSFDWLVADDLPSISPQNILWARHQHIFAGLGWEESKRRYYKQLYFHGVTPDGLRKLLYRDFVTIIALFGWGRHSDRLSIDAKPLTEEEIEAEVKNYKAYLDNFDRVEAANPTINWVIVGAENTDELEIIQKWYSLTDEEKVGDFLLYKARLK
ncbi:MAG TPA: hypothetical protein VNK26_04185 [Pyrinomonadaceae bacterium]|nr:hypothetical protein [Pyrinomonadaceae bacterium]